MTTQTSFSEKRSVKNMNFKYFCGELQRSWPRMVLFLIVFILTMIVPIYMNNFGEIYYSTDISEEERILRNSTGMLSFVTEYVQIWTLLSIAAAFISGLFVTRFLNDKVSADFYHSIPIKREGLFVSRITVGFANYFITFFICQFL